MKVIVDRLNQLPHQSLNGVSRRKVGRRAAQEEGGHREEVVAPAPSITGVTSQGHTCAPGAPAQQVYLQETGTWKEAQEQLVRYQMAGQDQRLLLCPDLRQEREQMQGQTPLSQERGHLGLSQEKKAFCGATQAFCPHSVHLETIQKQL